MYKYVLFALVLITSNFFIAAMEQVVLPSETVAQPHLSKVKSLKKCCLKAIINHPQTLTKAGAAAPDLKEALKKKVIRENLLYFVDIFKSISMKELLQAD